MKFKTVKSGNPSDPAVPHKQYAISGNAGKFTMKDSSKEIVERSSPTRGDIKGDIKNVLNDFPDVLPTS